MSKHEEFPIVTPAAQAAAVISLGYSIDSMDSVEIHRHYRVQLAAFLREAMKQARKGYGETLWDELNAIADNLHSQPPPPTLAKARAADLDTPAGRDVVRNFLASLGEVEA